MGKACGTNETREKRKRFQREYMTERDHLEDLVVGRIVINKS
jgi:hypothetical protein